MSATTGSILMSLGAVVALAGIGLWAYSDNVAELGLDEIGRYITFVGAGMAVAGFIRLRNEKDRDSA